MVSYQLVSDDFASNAVLIQIFLVLLVIYWTIVIVLNQPLHCPWIGTWWPDVKFSYASQKAVNEYKEAKEVCFCCNFFSSFLLSVYPFIHSIKRVFSCKGGKFPNCWIPMYLNCQEIRNIGQLYTFTPRTAIKFHVFYDRTPSK